jgi:polysaccharide export outer membrane protein
VFVTTMESHPVSVVGAVKKPVVFQVRGPKSVLEMISMAEGLADDAGEAVLVMRGAGLGSSSGDEKQLQANDLAKTDRDTSASEANGSADELAGNQQTLRINLKSLMQSEDPQLNVPVYPGDIVKVVRAGVVYVVGEVKKPGGFVLKSDERMSVLKAIALAEGLTPTSAKSGARIIRSDLHGAQKEEIPINLGKILAGKAPDPTLSAADIVFVPNSTGKTATYKGSQAVISALVSLMIFRW